MVVKTYRGLLADGGQDRIPLSTKDGSMGYRIVKFQAFPNQPGTSDWESTLQVFKTEQTSISTTSAVVNFTDNDLLAAIYYPESSNLSYSGMPTVIFDSEIFNQDIFITHTETAGTMKINYYIELEQIKLDHTQNMSATLKAIRGSALD